MADTTTHPAVRPYPAEHATCNRFGDDLLFVRPMRPDDEAMLARFHAGLSEETVRLRYFCTMGLSARIAHPRLGHLCHADYNRELALVAELPGADGTDRIVAVARLNRDRADPATAELAVVVDDAWQRKGLGRYLVRRFVDIAPREGYRRIVAAMLPENAAMIRLLRSEGFEIASDADAGVTRAWRLLECPASAS
jgi:acetyltransferase